MVKKQQAQQLYMSGLITQKEIAEKVGVSERTIYNWTHQYAWDKLRLAAWQAPVTIADNLCSQIVELQNAIARKAPGARYPNLQEAEIMRKLIVMLGNMKKTPSLSQNMQVLETFRNYVRPKDKAFTRQLANYTEQFLEGKAVNGYAPYEAEYGVAPMPPVSHVYEETDEDIDPAIGSSSDNQPCPDFNTCLHVGNCTYPHCLHPERHKKPVDPLTQYNVTPVLYSRHSDPDYRRDELHSEPVIVSFSPNDVTVSLPNCELHTLSADINSHSFNEGCGEGGEPDQTVQHELHQENHVNRANHGSDNQQKPEETGNIDCGTTEPCQLQTAICNSNDSNSEDCRLQTAACIHGPDTPNSFLLQSLSANAIYIMPK